MTPIDKLPEMDWSETALREISETEHDLVAQSSEAWRIKDFAVVGLVQTSLLQPPWLWFALAKKTTIGDLADLRRLQERIPRGTTTGVAAADKRCVRFAEFYGFEKTGKVNLHKGVEYLIMRKK